jgi:hypothetical protein
MKKRANHQLHDDLQNQLKNKLKIWAKDAFALYEMADLHPTDCVTAMIAEMTYATIIMLRGTTKITPEEFGAIMTLTFASFQASENEDEIELELLHPKVRPEVFGIIPEFLDLTDPRPAREQFNEHYAHGGGWRPMKGWKLMDDNSIWYPSEEDSDPPCVPLAQVKFRKELIVLYEHAWVAVIQPDRSFEVCRMD